ncbi:MAG: endonuclease/exonuclease/phosphatase family protein [Nocardiaceae bacterium]|nr:endonuclease/exonuclease/phosphatase family protein [Nocardiaceae bacterium]
MRLIEPMKNGGTRWVSPFFVRGLVRLGSWLAVGAGAAGIALHFVRLQNKLVIVLASGVPLLVLAGVIGFVGLVLLRRGREAIVAGVVALIGIGTQLPLFLASDVPDHGIRVTVMQANVLFDGADPNAFVRQVRDHHVEILTVDELTPGAAEAFAEAGLGEVLPYRYIEPATFATGTGIYSRFPLSDLVSHSGYLMNQLSASVDVPRLGPVTVHALHPVQPLYGSQDWVSELNRLRGILDSTNPGRPAIAGGDFNATFDHAQFRALLGRFEDATDQAGAGYLLTYPTDKWTGPAVGLDHVLVSGGVATDIRTVDVKGSDHRALVAKVTFTRS